jgi:DNA (cytosine-5)-methyltransferase 1
MNTVKSYPFVDLFAGPGGLGEGFSSLISASGNSSFEGVISIEHDEAAHQTLLLRHFFRSFPRENVPDEYYAYINNEITLESLFSSYPEQHEKALQTAKCISLGAENHKTIRSLVKDRIDARERWALLGGPPCQAYSLVGRSRMTVNADFEDDERHFLYREYLRVIADNEPPVFVMENVKGLLSAKNHGASMIDKITDDLETPGYAVNQSLTAAKYRLHSLSPSETVFGDDDPRRFIVKAENFGVPQARHRMFILGIRDDLDLDPKALVEHEGPSVRETIENLPPLRSGLSKGLDSADSWRGELEKIDQDDLTAYLKTSGFGPAILSRINSILRQPGLGIHARESSESPSMIASNHPVLQQMSDKRLRNLSGHATRSHMGSDLRRYLFASAYAEVTGKSPKLAEFPSTLLPNHRNVEEGRKGKKFADRFRVQLADGKATTVTSHISKDGHYFIHYDPEQSRSLTLREAARLQTFPDNYKFEGTRTAQYHQVGNAVPPYLAKQIAEVVADVLDRV